MYRAKHVHNVCLFTGVKRQIDIRTYTSGNLSGGTSMSRYLILSSLAVLELTHEYGIN